jgi:lactate dehydrogenase-like 2-hydroxyacid dehydrogenase
MTTTQKDQLAGNEATLVNTARGQLKSFADKLRALLRDADDALMGMDAQLMDFDSAHPERSEMTTTEHKQAQEQRS